MDNSDGWSPKIFRLKNKNNEEVEINSSFIFYIHVSKEVNTIYLTEPVKIGNEKVWKIFWKTRTYGVKKILNYLKGKGFIQVNRTTIVRKLHISGRDGDWKYIYITMPTNRTTGEDFDSWKNVLLPLGRSYAFHAKTHVLDTKFIVKNEDGDIFFISPLDLVFVESSKGLKKLHLNKPVCRNDKNNYTLEWFDRNPFDRLIPSDAKIWFLQVHRKYFVRIDYPFKIINERGSAFLYLEKPQKISPENPGIYYNRKIPVGRKYKEKCIEVFKK
jgi:hypothetical protein